MTYWQALLLAVVEGITEFLPVSSTGHMIIAKSVLGTPKDDFYKLFIIAIQLGAILSVVVLYRKKFFALTPENKLKYIKTIQDYIYSQDNGSENFCDTTAKILKSYALVS